MAAGIINAMVISGIISDNVGIILAPSHPMKYDWGERLLIEVNVSIIPQSGVGVY